MAELPYLPPRNEGTVGLEPDPDQLVSFDHLSYRSFARAIRKAYSMDLQAIADTSTEFAFTAMTTGYEGMLGRHHTVVDVTTDKDDNVTSTIEVSEKMDSKEAVSGRKRSVAETMTESVKRSFYEGGRDRTINVVKTPSKIGSKLGRRATRKTVAVLKYATDPEA